VKCLQFKKKIFQKRKEINQIKTYTSLLDVTRLSFEILFLKQTLFFMLFVIAVKYNPSN